MSALPTPPHRLPSQWKRSKDNANGQVPADSDNVPVSESPGKRDASTNRPIKFDKDPSVAVQAARDVTEEKGKQDPVEHPLDGNLVHQQGQQEAKLSRSLLDTKQQAESVQALFNLVSQHDAEQASSESNTSRVGTDDKSRSSSVEEMESGDGGERVGGTALSITASDGEQVLLESNMQTPTIEKLTSGE